MLMQVLLYQSCQRHLGSIAQLGEHLPSKQRVTGSSPVVPTKNRQVSTCRFFIHCVSNGISSRGTRVSHHRRCISSAAGCIFPSTVDAQASNLEETILYVYKPSRICYNDIIKSETRNENESKRKIFEIHFIRN